MAHGDDKQLALPPNVAQYQVSVTKTASLLCYIILHLGCYCTLRYQLEHIRLRERPAHSYV